MTLFYYIHFYDDVFPMCIYVEIFKNRVNGGMATKVHLLMQHNHHNQINYLLYELSLSHVCVCMSVCIRRVI